MKNVTNQRIVEVLKTVLDPEVGINVIDLGLIYGIAVHGGEVRVIMTMTSQACPLNSYFQQAVENTIRRQVPEVTSVEIELMWQPEWQPTMMSQDAKRLMGWGS